MENNMVYQLKGWSRRKDTSLGASVFSVELDAEFAQKVKGMKFPHQQRFVEIAREITGDKYARVTFFEDTAFVRSMAVDGNCCCLGMSGSLLEADWSRMDVIRYDGHNIDSKEQAYDLLTIFTYWVETVQAFLS